MLTQLGRLVIRRPWLIIAPVVVVTLVLASFLPTLEFRTNFSDFAPDDPLTVANTRVQTDFGSSQHLLFLHVNTTDSHGILSPESLREQYRLSQILQAPSFINGTVGVADLVNNACQLEYNASVENCTDDQLTIILHDLFSPPPTDPVALLISNDPNEAVDTHPRLGHGRSADALDVKSCYLSKTNDTLTATIQVYNLSSVTTSLQPPIPRTRLVEWYLGFVNHFTSAGVDLSYQLSVRLEPRNPLWIHGNGLASNLRALRVNRDTRHAYAATAYLWVTPPGQTMAFPITLNTSSVSFDRDNNNVTVTVSRQELGTYGIAPTYGSFSLPAKLTNFSAGTRTYTPLLFPRRGDGITFNTTTLLKKVTSLQQRRILGALLDRMFTRLGIPSDMLQTLTNTSSSITLPPTFSASDLQSRWTQLDTTPDTGTSPVIYPLLPAFFPDLHTNILSFLPSTNQTTSSTQDTIILVFLPPTSDTELVDQLTQQVRGVIHNSSSAFPILSVIVTGPDVVSTEINKVAMDANTIIAPLIFVLIVIILFIAFRKPSYVVHPILVFVLSTIWLFGTMAMLHIPFNIIAVAILPLNIGLGVEYSVNLLFNYRIEREKGNSAADAVFLSIKEVGIAIFLAWATTFVAFISFLSATIPPIRNFGLFLALGISYTFIISMTCLMAMRYLADRSKPYKSTYRESSLSIQTQLRKVAGLLLRHDKAVFLVAILVSLVMLVGVTQLKTGFSESQFIPQDNKSLQELTTISKQFPFASQDQSYILIEGNVATVSTLQGIAETQNRLRDDHYIATTAAGDPKTTNIYSIMQKALADNQSLKEVFHVDPGTGLPKEDTDVAAFYNYLYDNTAYSTDAQSVLNRNDGQYNATVIRVYVSMSSDKDMTVEYKVLQDDLKADVSTYGSATATVTGSDLITYFIVVSMTQSQLLSTGICFVLAAVMLIVIYRRPTLGLVAMIPVSMSMIWVLGTMYFIGYTLNVLTITVTSITIGVGIDYAVYITERFRLVVDRTGDINQAVIEAISRTGSGVSIAAVSSIFGFGILMLAPIPPEQQFGLITAITLLYAIMTSIFILPLILARWARWRRKRVGYVISPGAPKDTGGLIETEKK